MGNERGFSLNAFHPNPRYILALACASFSLSSLAAEGHDGARQQESDRSRAALSFFTLKYNSDGEVIRELGPVNRNGKQEKMVKWNECGKSDGTGLSAQVTWDYEPKRKAAALPTNSDDMVNCTTRNISEAFVNFLEKNMKFCIAAASMPSVQSEVAKVISSLKETHGSVYKTKMGPNGLLIDEKMSAKLSTVFTDKAEAIAKEVSSISGVKLLHQGIAGDDHHTSTSYHAKEAMRAIDMSHLQVTRETKDADGSTVKTNKLYQHNVASFAEDKVIHGNASDLSDEQKSQHAFWQSYGACIQQKGGEVISNCIHHTSSGFKHQGHMHVSLPYDPRGAYNSK